MVHGHQISTKNPAIRHQHMQISILLSTASFCFSFRQNSNATFYSETQLTFTHAITRLPVVRKTCTDKVLEAPYSHLKECLCIGLALIFDYKAKKAIDPSTHNTDGWTFPSAPFLALLDPVTARKSPDRHRKHLNHLSRVGTVRGFEDVYEYYTEGSNLVLECHR